MIRSTSGERQKRRKGYARRFHAFAPFRHRTEASRLGREEERALVAAAREGDRRALSSLLTRLTGPVYRYGRAFCGDPHDAEDVTQVVLLALARTLHEFRGESALTTWAYSVAKRACARQRRRRAGAPGRFTSLEQADRGGPHDLEDQNQDPQRSLERARLARAIESAIQALPASQREVLILRDVEGLPASQVGRTLGLKVSVVKARLHRARAALRSTLAPWLPAHPRRGVPTGTCRDTLRLISQHLEGDLSESSCAALQRHVESCANCDYLCDSLRRILGACRSVKGAAVPSEVRAGVRAALRRLLEETHD